ncbi:MAG: hypothetical protein KIH63_000170 [Candidatus Saccharibacteria bacterium]|nr:hypothetical protein [Candidatus Saccharibacteria bacterium]
MVTFITVGTLQLVQSASMSGRRIGGEISALASIDDVSAEIVTRRLPYAPQILEEEAGVFFGVGRLSQNYTVHAGVFRRLLPGVDMTPEEWPVYHDWLEVNAFVAMEDPRSQLSLSAREIEALRTAEDPAILVADALHDTYKGLHPDSQNDVRLWEKANHGIDLVLASIHRAHPNHLQAVVEMYEPALPTIDPAAQNR